MTARPSLVVGLVVFAGFVLISGTVYFSSREAEHRRHDICVQVQQVKRIIHDEHVQSLHRARAFLLAHPHGIDGIGRQDLLSAIQDQRKIVRATTPMKCPD